MKSIVFSVLSIMFLSWCGGGGKVVVKPAPREEDPFKELKEKFTAAYFEITCIANQGIDPDVSLVPLKKPVHFLKGLIEANDPRLDKCLKILNKHGFVSFESFRDAENRLRLEKEFWKDIEVQFIEQVKKCK